MSDAGDTPIALFPLQLVLLPGEVLPLHVFEERYKRLIAERRDGGRRSGSCCADDEAVAERGCLATVPRSSTSSTTGGSTSSWPGASASALSELSSPTIPTTIPGGRG